MYLLIICTDNKVNNLSCYLRIQNTEYYYAKYCVYLFLNFLFTNFLNLSYLWPLFPATARTTPHPALFACVHV